MNDPKTLNLADFRKRIGSEYWRSLNELSRDDFEQVVETEFPQGALALDRGVDRRDFVKLMGASMALGGLAACNRPAEKIVPYVRQPEGLIPGKPIFFASAMTISGYAHGVLVESHMGRPTKIEGNPDHPSSLGATNSFMQASILGLYDPDRSQVVRHLGEISTYSDFLAALQPELKAGATNGAGIRILTQSVTSPSLGAQIQQVLAQFPGAKWHQWEAAGGHNVREGLRLAFGGYANAVYHFDKANVVVALDSDFLDRGPGHLRYARDFSNRRRVRKGTKSINRLYAIESGPTGTGSIADHRLAVKPSQVEAFARGIAALLGSGESGVGGRSAAQDSQGSDTRQPAPDPRFIAALVRDLQNNRGASIVVAGEEQPPAVHAVAMALNQALGNIGSTITITDPVEVAPVNQLDSLKQLVADMSAGAVKTLIIIGGNPAYDAPGDLPFVKAMDNVPFRAHLSHYYDETSMHVHWHIPETHYLESWSDARAHDGTISIVQPLIAPLYNGRSPHEILGALLGGMDQSPYDVVRNYWQTKAGALNFNNTWRKWLNDGVIAGSALPARAGSASMPAPTPDTRPPSAYELRILPDPNIYDGRFANNGWLQELPKPQTKITWENVALISPKTAQAIGYDDKRRDELVNEKQTLIANVRYRGKTLRTPVWVVPGHADNTITMFLGYGRTAGGKLATPAEATSMLAPELAAFHLSGGTAGVDVTPFRFSDALNALHGGPGAEIELTSDGPYEIGCTQEHQSLNISDVGEDRGIIRSATFAEYLAKPDFVREHKPEEELSKESMYPGVEYKSHAWAMVIDTSVCTGCNGCVVACQSENNIPIVGKEQVVAEREMHWLRIDRYYKGDPANPEVFHQPVPCMQCESAPCEPVCPVGATSHSNEGLNDMTYNRCVGTRYCSNNCPYKVRRFNFFHYSDYETPALKAQRNPDVTVRTRGVMEKCTYCVQRINAAKINAEKDGKSGRRVRDGEIVTACQQACPTNAIVFGDMNDPSSAVAALKAEPTNYALLAELNTRPRTTYLGAIRNPNPEIKG
ncbi:MAG TPA: TAT-variant-translocated molybdopterin oxidoreductase [Thermoanaerobaculia bacterium]|jgi:molybdopterin-containing oxidoreductase family iron-sulfur binding subunit|nr:TAT-variant-translocated molybdopterin oxidoreductase [Thermoanaerobaculia bacterium]